MRTPLWKHCYGNLGSLSGVDFSDIITERFGSVCVWLSVYLIRHEYLCENVYTCLRETLGVSDVLHSSSVLTPGQTAGLTSASPLYFPHAFSLFPFLSVSFCVQLIVHFCASLFMFVRQCTCCLTIKAVDLKPGLGYVWRNMVLACVSVCVCQTGNVNHVSSSVEHSSTLSPTSLTLTLRLMCFYYGNSRGVTPRSWTKYSLRVHWCGDDM